MFGSAFCRRVSCLSCMLCCAYLFSVWSVRYFQKVLLYCSGIIVTENASIYTCYSNLASTCGDFLVVLFHNSGVIIGTVALVPVVVYTW